MGKHALQIEVDPQDSGSKLDNSEKGYQASPAHHNFMALAGQYFKKLEQNLESSSEFSASGEKITFSDDGFSFDETSVREAIILCKDLQKFLRGFSEEKFKKLKINFPFYRNEKEVVDRLVVLFTGSLSAKEKLVRIYATKAIGTYKVTKTILDTAELFEDLIHSDVVDIQKQLKTNADEGISRIMKMLTRKTVESMPKEQSTLVNLKHVLAQKDKLFDETHRYDVIATRYRELLFWAYANPTLMAYLDWKHQYLKFWMYTELCRMDLKNLESNKIQILQYGMIKLQAYQKLGGILSPLSPPENRYDPRYELTKTHYTCLSHAASFAKDASESVQAALGRARESEHELLGALTLNQVCTLAAAVHADIVKAARQDKIPGTLPPNVNNRSIDLDTEQKAEKKYMAASVKIHIEENESGGEKSQGILKALGRIAGRIKLFSNKADTKDLPSEVQEDSNEIPRAPGNEEGLELVFPDWSGFGQEYKSTIYEVKIPNIQKMFFEQESTKLRLGENFINLVNSLFALYQDHGIQRVTHKMGVTIHGKQTIKTFEDQAIYLKTADDEFLAFGIAPFSKTSEPSHYFQLYRKQCKKRYRGSTKNIDFSRSVDNETYHLIDFDSISEFRPLVFRSLIYVIDSLNDEVREQHLEFLKGIYSFLKGENTSENRRIS